MKNHFFSRFHLTVFISVFIFLACPCILTAEEATYDSLLRHFQTPDHAEYGEVPLWWWEGAKMSKDRITWQLETLAEKGVKAICPIQRSPGRCDPQSFEPAWWDIFRYVNRECKRLGIKLWAYDQIGYGHYGWLEKAAARTRDESTYKLEFKSTDVPPNRPYKQTLPQGKLILARAYPIQDGIASDEQSIDLADAVNENILKYQFPDQQWRVVTIVAKKQYAFYLSDAASDTFLDMLYGKIERTLGKEAMGTSFEGVFQDEHPPTPIDNYTQELDQLFSQRCGYSIGRAIPALHFNIGPKTPKYRTDFYDVYLDLVEKTYWKKIYDWTQERGILTSHDNWGRNNIYQQSRGYMDYFRTQRWFSSPGYDDAGQRAVTNRNYYDAKIASSIARLYDRPRVWNEAFHSSGWGRSTDQTISWLSAGMAFGANLYDEHGLYYSTNASTWEHAAPDPHWRQPYWHYYGTLSDWVARTSYLMSQGRHVVDAAVHYPVVSLLADISPDRSGIDYNLYMRLSRTLFNAEIDNDIVDDDSILNADIREGKLWMGQNGYQALVFGPEKTMRLSVLHKAAQFAQEGGTVVFYEGFPTASTESGRDDPAIDDLCTRLFSVPREKIDQAGKPIIHHLSNDGVAAFIPTGQDRLPALIGENIDRDFQSQAGGLYYTHRVVGDTHIYLVQNVKDTPNDIDVTFRVDAVPEIWNPFTGQVESVDRFERKHGYTHITHRLEGNTARFFIFKPGGKPAAVNHVSRLQPKGKPLSRQWQFSVIPTRDNVWGEFRWPPSKEIIGPEIRTFKYQEESRDVETAQWSQLDFNDQSWTEETYSIGPYWLMLGPIASTQDISKSFLSSLSTAKLDGTAQLQGEKYTWRALEFSKQIGLAKAVPWGGHSGYPDGHIDRNFIQLPKGRKLLFTHIHSPQADRVGLRVELRNSDARLWVNGKEQPFEGAVGNLPLNKGSNEVLLDLPDGDGGKLYVQKTPPSVQTLTEAAQNVIKPDLREANWIWVNEAHACYLRKTFTLSQKPEAARLVVTAFSGYRLFVNGYKLEEEIGPWARWTHPESFNIQPYLREGENVIALWGQLYFGQHVNRDAMNHRGAVLAMKARFKNGEALSINTDQSWKGIDQEKSGWESPNFNDEQWPGADVRGQMGDEPWGTALLENVGNVSEPKRPLSVNLSSPYLECFDQMPDIFYDIKAKDAQRMGWYRFHAPPGLYKMDLHTEADAQVWVNGKPVPIQQGVVTLSNPPKSVSQVAVRLHMKKGQYEGAAFTKPIRLELKGGVIETGDWKAYAMPTYSGIGVYKQTVTFTKNELQNKYILDLGEVKVAAEVFVNDRSAGVRLANPFKFDITPYLREGDNTLEIRVANTIAPHYTTIPALHLGPTQSGLLGPVRLHQELPKSRWINWAKDEIQQLKNTIHTPTPKLKARQKQWQKNAAWIPLEAESSEPSQGREYNNYIFGLGETKTPLTGLRFHLAALKSDSQCTLNNISASFIPQKETPIRGRYILVEIPSRSEYLSLAEVQVFSQDKNIAVEGKSKQSQTSAEGYARLAIDGNTDGRFFVSHSVTHTPSHHHPWWELDLGAVKPIDRIVLWNRTDRAQDQILRLHDFTVSVMDARRDMVWKTQIHDPPDPNIIFAFSGPRSLHLSNLQVWHEESKLATEVHTESQSHQVRFSSNKDKAYKLIAEIDGKLPPQEGQLFITLESDACTLKKISVSQMDAPLVNIPAPINHLLKKNNRNEEQENQIAEFYRTISPFFKTERIRLHGLARQLEKIIQDG